MIFKKVLEAVELIKVKRSDSDYIDRLNHRWTCILLVIACLLLTTANYGSLPMFCWCPAYFVSAYEKYAQKICWVSESYNIVDDRGQKFPASNRGSEDSRDSGGYYYSTQPQQSISSEGKKVLRVSYYQWIPLLLLLQSFFFYLPGLMWKTLAARSGLDLANIVEASDTVQNAIYPERREKTLRYMSRHINRFLTFQNNYRGGCCRCFRGVFRWRWCFCCGNKFGNYMSSLYLGLKLVNLANIVLQVLFIDFYLGSHFHLLGLAFIHGISTNQTTAMVTAIASNHPLIAHQGNNVYSPQNSGSMVKRDLGRVDLHSVSTNEGFFTASGIDITTINKSSQENPEILFKQNVDKSNETESTIYKNDPSANEGVSYTDNNLPIVDAKRVYKLSNRSRRDDRRTNEGNVNSHRHRQQKRSISGSYYWSTYMASLTSFPYLSSKLFPKITYCDFTVHQMTTIQLFTTQCVLSINFINEKLFLLLWFWFCLLFIINMYSFFIWSITLCFKSSRENYIRRQLAMIQRRIFLDSAQYNRQSPPQPPTQYPSSSYRPSVVESTLAERKFDLPPNVDDSEDKATELEPLRPSPAGRRLVKFDETLTMQDHQELSYEQAIKSFVHCRLKQDGVFILKILATNTTRLVELDVLALLWSVHERRLATSDPYYTSDRRESLIQPSSERRDTIVDVTELRRAKAAMSEREL